MAFSLAPAYLRIAGPSTAHMTFHNKTISINEINHDDLKSPGFITDVPKKVPLSFNSRSLEVTHQQWKRFVYWAKSTGFDLVFALNNEEKTVTGIWDPNTALRILTVAEKAKVGNIFWELGYECNNQSIEEYLNDLETLRYIIETFPPGRTEEWKVVGGDVTKCLQADSKSDFKDYLTLSNDMMDALLLNGNSTSYQMERMSEYDRMKILRMFARSETPLWLTEINRRQYNDLERAADWLARLGYSAKNGFTVHYRELEEEELYEPTLSFYMALLFKNLVGERVLNVNMEPQQAILFAHCTSLRHKPIPGAVTFFGANMDDEPARFSLKLSHREEGGDIMQFILGSDHNGNIVVNGRAMFYEGDLNPVVKRVSPYRTLIINLPPKAFGFWVLANTKIEACHDIENSNKTFIEAKTVNNARPKRAVDDDIDDVNVYVADISYDFEDFPNDYITVNAALRRRINDMNKGLKINKGIFQRHQNSGRVKRNDVESSIPRGKWRIPSLKDKIDRKFHRGFIPRGLLHDLLERARETVDNLNKNRVIKRNSLYPRISSFKPRNYKNVKSKPKYLPKTAVHNNGTANTYKSDKNNSEKLGTSEEKPKNIKTIVRKLS
ncbi:heparanase-like isoform X2 [Trichoplusia ni]|nr:heparanase-like isoform X2 [Trichoplusia ni]